MLLVYWSNVASGNEWYTQSTAGTINFYAVGNSGTKVDNSKDPINYPTNSNAPLVTFLKYTAIMLVLED